MSDYHQKKKYFSNYLVIYVLLNLNFWQIIARSEEYCDFIAVGVLLETSGVFYLFGNVWLLCNVPLYFLFGRVHFCCLCYSSNTNVTSTMTICELNIVESDTECRSLLQRLKVSDTLIDLSEILLSLVTLIDLAKLSIFLLNKSSYIMSAVLVLNDIKLFVSSL